MSLVSVTEAHESRRSETRLDRGVYTYHHYRTFKVRHDDPYEGTRAALDADDGTVAVPHLGDYWTSGDPTNPTYDYSCRAVDIQASPNAGDVFETIVTVHYTSSWGSDTTGPGQLYYSPIEPWPQNQWEWSTISSVEPVSHATDGTPLASSAGEPFDPLPTQEYHDKVLTITRGELFDDVAAVGAHMNLWNNTVNAQSFAGAPSQHVWLYDIGARTAFRAGIYYWVMRYHLRFRPYAWEPRQFLDHGIYELVSANGGYEMEHMRDAKGVPLVEPVLLDGSGHRLAYGGTPVYLKFPWFTAKDWTPLALLSMPKG